MLKNKRIAKKGFLPIIITLLMVCCFTFLLRQPVFAAECAGIDTSIVECESSEGGGVLREVLWIIVDAVSIGIGILAVIGIVITGTQYLTSSGNELQATKAKRRLAEIIAGVILYVGMWSFLNWLLPGGFVMGNVEVTKVSLPQNSSFYINRTVRVVPSIFPLDANNQSLTWESSNTAVATVDDKGTITTKGIGTTTITATSANKISATTTITVKPEPIEIDEREAYKHQSASNSNGEGLTETQAQQLANYYNSPDVNICDIANTCNKNDCSAFAAWFLVTFTDLKTNRIQNNIDTFWVYTGAYNFSDNIAGVPRQSTNPGPISVVSTIVGAGVPFNGSLKHVGIIVAYDGNESMTVEAASAGGGSSGWNAHVFHHVLADGLAYNNIDAHVNYKKLLDEIKKY